MGIKFKPNDIVMYSCHGACTLVEITEKDFYNNGIYYNGGELETLNKQKLIASNRNKAGFERNHITVYWLTEKGYKKLFAQ